RRTRTGAQYYNEFLTHFWERPEDEFDRIRNRNISNQTSPNNQSRRISVTSRSRRRSASPSQRATSERNNRRNENTSETVVTNENLDSGTYLSSSELANIPTSLNMSASQNDSDVSMFDVEGSQPPSYTEAINEEENQ
ncbi:14614_t:CDS:2, partial [Entrophospora sp. SA101]